MTTQKGEIVKWFENKRFGFIQPENTQGRDAQVFLHQSHASLPANKLKEGTVVEFETIRTDKGLNARNVRLPGGAAQSWPKGYRFLNPYNFVRSLPYRKMAEDAPFDVQLMGRTMPPTHDRWLGLSGTIECQFETITPLFVSDAEAVNIEKNISEKKKHYSYRFFRLNGKKAVPATSLRGMIRSVFEAATNSTFSNLGGERLSYRLPSNEVQKLVPARVEKTQGNDTNAFVLRLLPGTAPFAPDFGQKKGLYAAPARFYKALKPTGKYRRNPPSPIRNADDFDHGLPYFAVLREMKFPPSWRVVALFADKAAAEKERSAIASRQQGKFIVQSGWLCKTNQNSDNKNSERFFFRDQSRKDVPETIPLPPKERDKFEALIRDYQTRHESDKNKRSNPGAVEGDDIAFSRFVLNPKEAKLRDGDLVYVRLQGQSHNLKVMFMAPVSWPRVAYEHTIADLLPKHLHSAENRDQLDPAARLFGWVHGDGKKQDGAYAGRLRFTHAKLQKPGEKLSSQTLAILGSPKPTTTRFYLTGPNGKPSTKPQDDLSAGYDGHNGRNHLRGRKFYRHFVPNKKFMTSEDASDQNRTIRDAEGKGARFTFSVSFENLAPVELGALLWSLTLGGKGYHKLGYAKPLGLGSIELGITNLMLDDPAKRYQSITEDGRKTLSSEEQTTYVEQFQKAFCRLYVINQEIINAVESNEKNLWPVVFGDLPNVADLLTLHNKKAPDLPVHYPFSPDPNTNGQFEWFVGNNRLKGPRKELSLIQEDKGLPLIKKDGSIH